MTDEFWTGLLLGYLASSLLWVLLYLVTLAVLAGVGLV